MAWHEPHSARLDGLMFCGAGSAIGVDPGVGYFWSHFWGFGLFLIILGFLLFWIILIIFDYFLNILDNLLNIILLCKISTPKGDNA